ncbi:hypothetical protein [Herbaspirillum seropedicae]|uniref:hypothetical protein n=1 Tax=Herbaspirillum seropedicae TaxID=964 RepID=UPI003FCC5276
MYPALTNILALTAVVISLVSLHFTFRKDAHRIRLEVTPLKFDAIALGIKNDSACDADILAVGYFDSFGNITWLPQVGDYRTNQWVNYPISVKARSLYAVSMVAGRDVPSKEVLFGYCVQLATGRIYVLRGTTPWHVAIKMHFASLLSRISGGRYVIPSIKRVRLPTRV